MRARIRKNEGENLTDAAIESVLAKLNAEKPITKKDACAMLSITYNTTRLKNILETYAEQKEFTARRKKEVRNTPISTPDKSYIVSAYLNSEPLQDISDSVFRSVAVIKRVLKAYNIPVRNSTVTYHDPIDLENEELPMNDYKVGDLVYSARYDSPAEIRSKYTEDIYNIWLFNDCQFAYQPYYELGDLRMLQTELGIKLPHMSNGECQQVIRQALKDAKKRDKDK